MSTATSIFATEFGTFVLQCSDWGISRIYLPGIRSRPRKSVADSAASAAILADGEAQIREFLRGERTVFDLPLSISGTDFQLMVWEKIKAIPYGKTCSYSEIGRQLGDRRKARAVGGAANANPVPLVIPCHRVVGTDGNLTGFAGGLKLKKRLLDLEQNRPVG